MYRTAALFLAACLLAPHATAQEAPAACHAAYSSGATYGAGALVSAANTIQVTNEVACTFGDADLDCSKASCACTIDEETEVETCTDCTKMVTSDVAVACNYECFSDAWCSNDGYAPPGVNNVNPAFSAYAWTELDCPCDTSETAVAPTLPAPPAWDGSGCPSEFSASEEYGSGDAVSVCSDDPAQQWCLVYQCKSATPAPGKFCDMDGYEPGSSLYWEQAWTLEGSCSGTISPTASPNYEVLEDVGGCPDAWEETNYEEGDRVSAQGLVFECKGWPMGAHCGQPGYAPLVDDATPDAWTVAWTVVGHCSGTLGPSASPTFDDLVANIEGCPQEYSSEKYDYQGGEQVTLTVSEDPERKLVYECKAYPYVGYCNQHGPFAPGEQYASMAWALKGACTGTLSPTASPTEYDGECLYDRCRTIETTEACEVNLDDPHNANCPKTSCDCETTTDEDTNTVTETCTNCERTFDEEVCTPTQVDNWEQFTEPADLYQAGDYVRVGKTKYYCVDGNTVNCNSPSHQPEDASGLWLYYGIWVADGECPSPTMSPPSSPITCAAKRFSPLGGNGGTLLSALSDTDDDTELVDLPFTFNFLNEYAVTEVRVSSNGQINILRTDTNSNCCSASPVAPGAYTNPRIAIAQEDLYPFYGEIYTRTNLDGSFTISFESVVFCCGAESGDVNAQATLFPSGDVDICFGAGNTNGRIFASGLEDDASGQYYPNTMAGFGATGIFPASGVYPAPGCFCYVNSAP